MARAAVKIALDRSAQEAVSSFVEPLNAALVAANIGRVVSHREAHGGFYLVETRLESKHVFESLLDILADLDVPIGSVVYRLDWFGRKRDILVLGPE